ncbi:hypothetical protein [uncultured Bifidobacterium sp.]|uniref:hypothetical protein n=1 Tax=uncultured Bifidobacterium sp. TaxID=165187 RepID=UPI00259A2C52|nr:hypothetical protein [uncultured Bifidobacterium sp.]
MRIGKGIGICVMLLASLVLGACGSDAANAGPVTGTEVSRVKLYQSTEQMADDSDLIVVGSVSNTRTVQDLDDTTDFTLANVKVLATIKGDADDDTIVVRQTGSVEQGDSELLISSGDTVMLFLVHSGLDGELADQYYITGATAGLYSIDAVDSMSSLARGDDSPADDAHFQRVDMQSGDSLPQTLTMEDVEAMTN